MSKEQHIKRYKELCAERDAVNAKIAPLKAKLDEANIAADRARLESMRLASEINKVRGGEKWLELKREIAVLARVAQGR